MSSDNIIHSVPNDKREPGAYHEFDDVSGARGLSPQNRRIAVVGQWDDSADDGRPTVDTPFQVFDENDANNAFGIGSELAIGCRAVFKQFVLEGSAAQVWGVPIADAGGVAGVIRFAVAGTASADGDVVVELNGEVIRASVNDGDAAATVAQALVDAINARATLGALPGTAAVATSVNADFTHTNTGVWGNDAHYAVLSSPAGITVTPSQSVTATGAADPTAALGNLFSRDYDMVVIGNHASADITTLNSHVDDAWGLTRKRFRHAILGEVGTISTATTLAASANRKQILIVSGEAWKAQTIELAGAAGAAFVSKDKPNYNFDGRRIWCKPADDGDIYISTEVETALAGGVIPLSVNLQGEGIIKRAVTTKTTEGGNPFENLLDYGHSKTVMFLARQMDARLSRMLEGNNVDDELLRDIRSAAQDILKAAEDAGWVHKVDEHMPELKVERDNEVAGRIVVSLPESVVPAAHQVVAVHKLFVE